MMKTTKDEWVEFIHKLDWEGGIISMLSYGGAQSFPSEARSAAEIIEDELGFIKEVIEGKREEFGIEEDVV